MDNIIAPSNPAGEVIPCENTCPTTAFQLVDVCVPVTVIPFAHAGTPKTLCCGEARVNPGKDECCGRPNGTCTFTLSQKICVEIPVVFGAKAVVGATSVECEKVSTKNICKDCKKEWED